MGAASSEGDEEIISAINVTPLVDVVLVLLIVLMVTATAIASKSIPVELPSAATAEQTAEAPTTLAISIDREGGLFLDGHAITAARLRARVRESRGSDAETRAIVAADARVIHAEVVRVIDLLRREGVSRFAINVSPADLADEEP